MPVFTEHYRMPPQPVGMGPSGELEIRAYRRYRGEDKLEELLTYLINNPRNLVVNTARTILSRSIAVGSATNDWIITRMKLGTGGLDGFGDPRTPVITETDLAVPIALDGVTDGWMTTSYAFDGYAVEYTATLDYAEGNGESYSEEGIFCQNNDPDPAGQPGTMFAIKTFPVLVKTLDWKFVFTHRIRF